MQPPDDPLGGAEREFEAYELALWTQLMAMVQRGIPHDATVAEAIEEMRRAAAEDEDIIELTFRIVSIAQLGGGSYIRDQLEKPQIIHTNAEPVYKLADHPTRPKVEEEIDLMDRLAKGIDARVPSDLPEEERTARTRDLLHDDPELAPMADRLQELSESHDESVMLGLAKLAEEEVEEREQAEEEMQEAEERKVDRGEE
jgi:hypothetical protein